jgi:hypothetical protein
MSDQPSIVNRRTGVPHHECKQEPVVAMLQRSLADMASDIKQVLIQITKVAVLEAQHQASQADIDRAHKYVADLEKKHDSDQKEVEDSIKSLSVETQAFINQTKGFNKAVGWMFTILGGTSFILLIKILFFLGANGATIG